MRKVISAIVIALATLGLALVFAYVVINSQPGVSHHIKGAYYPYSVEMSVRDR